MAERKVFRVATADSASPIPFDVIITNAEGEERTLTFEAYGKEPADATMILSKMSRVDEEGNSVVDGAGLAKFLDKCLVGESKQRWRDMVADEEWKIEASIITEAFGFIQKEWTGRPTVRPSSSSDGPQTTSQTSTDDASSGASTS